MCKIEVFRIMYKIKMYQKQKGRQISQSGGIGGSTLLGDKQAQVQICRLLALNPWASYSTSLVFSVFIYEMGIIKASTLQGCGED